MSGMSDAQKVGGMGSSAGGYRMGRVNIEELTTELRHKYLTILKSCYWEFFESGQCMQESVIVLMESADRAMDHEESPIEDWGFILSYIISDSYIKLLSSLSSIPCLGKLFRQKLFEHFSLSYDIIVNFIEGHELAKKNIMMVIQNKEFVNKILMESQKQIQGAEQYMFSHIEEMFPEICKAI